MKTPKLYFRDTGLLHFFQGIPSLDDLRAHPLLGASWEGFALVQVAQMLGADVRETYLWAKHSQAELDLLIVRGGKLEAYEFKYSSAPKVTRSMRSVFADLGVGKITIVYPGTGTYRLAESIEVTNLYDLAKRSANL